MVFEAGNDKEQRCVRATLCGYVWPRLDARTSLDTDTLFHRSVWVCWQETGPYGAEDCGVAACYGIRCQIRSGGRWDGTD